MIEIVLSVFMRDPNWVWRGPGFLNIPGARLGVLIRGRWVVGTSRAECGRYIQTSMGHRG
jgi:hypothetical protein